MPHPGPWRPSAAGRAQQLHQQLLWIGCLIGLGAAGCTRAAAQALPRPAGSAAAASTPAPSLQPNPPSSTTVERIEVLAFRSPVAALESPVSTRVLSPERLRQAAPVGLDGKLRTVPGFDLFRRSSSLVANPTTEGVSLRGLGSTAASRTLVLLGDVPLNDPYGGWVHWEEVPGLAIGRVEVVRGGVSDLYGSSAMGGVVQLTTLPTAEPPGGTRRAAPELVLESGYGAEGLNDNGARLRGEHNRWSALAAGELTATNGYILVAPNLRGPVDARSDVHAGSGLVLVERGLGQRGSGQGMWLRGNMLDESRHNGTVLTGNATHLWRYAAGLDANSWGGAWELRGWGSVETFRQNFSSVATGRVSETLTRSAYDPADELGGALRWRRAFSPTLVGLAGADVRDIRAEDIEQPTAPTTAATSTTARQTDEGGYAELLWTPGPWLVSGSARADHFENKDAASYTLGSGQRTPLPAIVQTIGDPRIGISRQLRSGLAASASGYRAYRAPTENELYRTGQVGQQTTLANPSLRAERATGWEIGLAGEQPPVERRPLDGSWRASYFWTEVNRPVTALTLMTTASATTLQRENLGQIRSRGVSVDGALHPAPWLELTGGYQLARATVTRFAPEPALVGNWIPQVPRNTGTLQTTLSDRRWGLLSLQARSSGRQFDDDANTFVLHGYTRFDVYASRDFGAHWQVFTSVENLLDRSIDVGRTPVRTLGTPQLARFGVRWTLGGER